MKIIKQDSNNLSLIISTENTPFFIWTSLRALAGGRGTPLSGSWMILMRASMVMSRSVSDDILVLSGPPVPPSSKAALRGLVFFFFSLTFV